VSALIRAMIVVVALVVVVVASFAGAVAITRGAFDD
jgi:hypothetical protein